MLFPLEAHPFHFQVKLLLRHQNANGLGNSDPTDEVGGCDLVLHHSMTGDERADPA